MSRLVRRFTLRWPALLGLLLCTLLTIPLTWADVTGRVVAVTDGDTVRVLEGEDAQHKVRLTGIDAPERGQPFGRMNPAHVPLTSLLA